ncbi:hypothetical protein BDA99DRAFT_513568 [Phascolomyces articulosus]|uniref:Heterokaryon incompatibility domain-containing protein n=1 Tax=Phascolomyces articulosus TaxID=60185 RepID=A0AAD5K7G3_9FUNG|nr:hypothetical protein BDA99DRAFT_513568 [Phascolomyces articulosus]
MILLTGKRNRKKMFIEYYSSDQRFVEPELSSDCWLSATGGTYRPTWLVRTSDWELVPGSEAKNGYCALSYCWEQSGEIIKMENCDEYDCNNNPGHRLVIKKPEALASAPTLLESTGSIDVSNESNTSNNDYDDDGDDFDYDYDHDHDKNGDNNMMDSEYQYMPILERARRKNRDKVTQMVTYDGILQQICQDFQIDYLWYDKLCINQTNKAEKLREIKQMHLIYSNARFTVALVPEVNITNPADFERPDPYAKTKARKKAHDIIMSKSQWSKRSWTFEELMMSKRILIVGRNVHAWHQANTYDEKDDDNSNEESLLSPFADPLVQILDFKNRKLKSANQVLKYAQFRTSAKEHDKIFALANIFHGVIPIDIDYDSDIQQVVYNFYRRVAERDLSVMCFGTVRSKGGGVRLKSMMSCYRLPSWTGVRGLHTHGAVHTTQLPTSDSDRSDHFIDNEMRLHIKCKYLSIQPTKHDDSHPDACVLKGKAYLFDGHNTEAATFISQSTTSNSNDKKKKKNKVKSDPTSMMGNAGCGATHYWKPTTLPGQISSLCSDDDEATSTTFQLSLTTQYCTDCVILPILFDSQRPCFVEQIDGTGWKTEYRHSYFLPVLSKKANSSAYMAIGIVLFKLYTHTQIPKDPLSVLEETFGDCGEEFDFIIE